MKKCSQKWSIYVNSTKTRSYKKFQGRLLNSVCLQCKTLFFSRTSAWRRLFWDRNLPSLSLSDGKTIWLRRMYGACSCIMWESVRDVHICMNICENGCWPVSAQHRNHLFIMCLRKCMRTASCDTSLICAVLLCQCICWCITRMRISMLIPVFLWMRHFFFFFHLARQCRWIYWVHEIHWQRKPDF